jgi:hypothetical protein
MWGQIPQKHGNTFICFSLTQNNGTFSGTKTIVKQRKEVISTENGSFLIFYKSSVENRDKFWACVIYDKYSRLANKDISVPIPETDGGRFWILFLFQQTMCDHRFTTVSSMTNGGNDLEKAIGSLWVLSYALNFTFFTILSPIRKEVISTENRSFLIFCKRRVVKVEIFWACVI